LLIEDGNPLILIDTGMGNKQSEKFYGYYSLWGSHSLDKLAEHGFHVMILQMFYDAFTF
jgi:hypothetical protein